MLKMAVQQDRRREKSGEAPIYHPPSPEPAKTGSVPWVPWRFFRPENEAREGARLGEPGPGRV
jgi:hypothetical protein